MLETRSALHTVLGLFAVFLRDSIKRVAISGTSLPGVALADDIDGLNTACKTHAIIPLDKVALRQIRLHYDIRGTNLRPRNSFNRSLRNLVVNGGTQIAQVITHRYEKSEENEKKVASSENQEIHGGVLEDLVKKARHTTNTGETSFVTFCGIHDDKQSRGVFDREGVEYQCVGGGWRRERTVH